MARVETYEIKPFGVVAPEKQTVIDIRGFGKGIGDVGTAFADYANSMRIADRQSKQIEIDEYFINERLRISTLKGQDAIGEIENLERSGERYVSSVLSGEQNIRTREELDIYTRTRLNQHKVWVAEYELRQGDVYRQEVDVAFRNNAQKKLTQIPVGDTESIDQQIAVSVTAAKEREGENRWSEAKESVYRQGVRDEFYLNKIQTWYQDNPDLAYEWFKDNRDMLKNVISPEAYNAVSKLHSQNALEAETESLYKSTLGKYGNNFLGAALDLSSNPTKSGQAVSNRMYSNYLRQKALVDQRKKESEEAISEGISAYVADIESIEDVRERNVAYQALAQSIKESTVLNLGEKRKALENISKLNLDVVPEKVIRLYDDIEEGKVDSVKDIALNLGDGIGPSITPYVNRLNRRKSLQGKGNTDYFADALKDFDDIVKMTTPKARRRAFKEGGDPTVLMDSDKKLFKQKLRSFMKQNDLSNYDPKVWEEADRLLKIQQKKVEGWWSKLWSSFTGEEEMEDVGYTFKTGEEQEAEVQEPVTSDINATQAEFERLYNNVEAIPGESVDDKTEYMRNLYESATGKTMVDEVYESIRQRIESGD